VPTYRQQSSNRSERKCQQSANSVKKAPTKGQQSAYSVKKASKKRQQWANRLQQTERQQSANATAPTDYRAPTAPTERQQRAISANTTRNELAHNTFCTLFAVSAI
jgi:hypothetical protein